MKKRFSAEEKKIVTVLFADLSNFTEISHKIDPEDIVKVVNISFMYLNKVVNKYGGFIHKYEGDSVICLFGFPRTYEDAPERAVKAAVEMMDTIPLINKEISSHMKMEINFNLHVGVASGLAVIGEVGGEDKKEFTVMGDVVNLASRLKEIAKPGEIIVSDFIFRTTNHIIEYQRRGPLHIKGMGENIEVFKVLNIRKEPGPRRGIKGLHSPLVGREREFEFVKERVEALTRGKGGVLFIQGDPGIGKSRLWEEVLKNYIKKEDINIMLLTGHCLYHGETLSYWPILQILEKVFEITDGDNPDEIREKIINKSRELLPEVWEEVAPYIGHLFSVKFNNYLDDKVAYLDSKILQIKIFVAFKTLLYVLSKKKPIIMVIEDYHWIDTSSLGVIEFIFDTSIIPGILLVCITRVDKEKESFRVKERLKISLKNNFHEITLSPLDKKKSEILAYNLLNIPGFSREFKEAILKKAEGNPFFIEEIIHSLIERGVLINENGVWKVNKPVENITIPDTIQLVISARLDRLDKNLKEVLETASVIGKSFYKRILDYVMGEDSDTVRSLIELEKYDFILRVIKEDNFKEDMKYVFKHPLIQEVVYNNLLKSKRERLHARVAETMEILYRDRMEDFTDLIAQQYANSNNYHKAIFWLKKAAKKAEKNYANQDAKNYYSTIIEIVNKYSPENKDDLILAYESLGDLCSLTGKHSEAQKNYRTAFNLTEDNIIKARIKEKIATSYQRESKFEEAFASLEEARKLLEKVSLKTGEDEKIHAAFNRIYHNLAWLNYLVGNFEKSQEFCNRALKEIVKFKDEKKRNLSSAGVFNILAAIEGRKGNFEKSYIYNKRSLDIYKKYNNLPGLGTIYNNFVMYFSNKGDYVSAIEYLKKSVEIAKKIGNPLSETISYYNLGAQYLELGDLKKAEEYFNKYENLNRLINNRLGHGWANEGYAGIEIERGNYKKALEYIKIAINTFKELGSKIKEMDAKLTQVDILTKMGYYLEATILLEEIKSYQARHPEMASLEIPIKSIEAVLLYKNGKNKKAFKELRELEILLKEHNYIMELPEVYFHMGNILREEHDERYKEYYILAHNTLMEIASNIRDDNLKRTFLNKRVNKDIIEQFNRLNKD